MSAGVPILDTVTIPCQVHKIDDYTFSIILTQVLNRQIRRMCEFLGYQVKALSRIRIMDIKLDGIDYDTWRYLTDDEIARLMQMVKDSRK